MFAVPLLLLSATDDDGFDAWARAHGRRYVPEERALRHLNFVDYRASVRQAELANPAATFVLDEYADWSTEELAGLRGGAIDTRAAAEQPAFGPSLGDPKPIDWGIAASEANPRLAEKANLCYSPVRLVPEQWRSGRSTRP